MPINLQRPGTITPRDTLSYIDNLTGMTPGGGGGGLYPGQSPGQSQPFGRGQNSNSPEYIQARIDAIQRQIQMLMMQAMQGDSSALQKIQRLEMELAQLQAQLAQALKGQALREKMGGVGQSTTMGSGVGGTGGQGRGPSGTRERYYAGSTQGGGGGGGGGGRAGKSRPPVIYGGDQSGSTSQGGQWSWPKPTPPVWG